MKINIYVSLSRELPNLNDQLTPTRRQFRSWSLLLQNVLYGGHASDFPRSPSSDFILFILTKMFVELITANVEITHQQICPNLGTTRGIEKYFFTMVERWLRLILVRVHHVPRWRIFFARIFGTKINLSTLVESFTFMIMCWVQKPDE